MTTSRSESGLVPVIVDTREQLPYSFDPQKIEIIRESLASGDYSLRGFEARVTIERKTLSDFVASITQNRDRFWQEILRLTKFGRACVVIEADFTDILAGRYRSNTHPNAVLGTILCINVDYSIPTYFCSDRASAQRFVEGYLIRAWKKLSAHMSKSDETNTK